ncbi:hypothetical protein QFC22_001149 [Naganishia vaughanmartiniae]|uniref:Uncharacterized protein n=1 Tax=Naganishia vaughanmartiniae TaxID=1424756 RepID=A0ACC2XLW6_9TREE|nr:hypothetical protein QFC22_001149 [Naganishia vaughanmartiniae]
MDRIREKMNQMSVRAEDAEKRAEEAEETIKTLKQDLLQKEQLITSLEHRLKTAEDESEKHETALKDLKTRAEEGEGHRTNHENLTRKVQMLEEELERNEKELKDATEKLRVVDVKAEHFERAVQRAEQERDAIEKKLDEANDKLKASQQELNELVSQMDTLNHAASMADSFSHSSVPALPDNDIDAHSPMVTDIPALNPPVVPTFQYPSLDLDPTDAFTSLKPNPRLPPQRPSMTRRATSSFIQASARASTVAAIPLVHAFLFLFSLIAVSPSNDGSGIADDQGETNSMEPDAGLGGVMRSQRSSRRHYPRQGDGNQDTYRITGRNSQEQPHTRTVTSEEIETTMYNVGDGGAKDEDEQLDKDAVFPGGWISGRSSR